MHFVFAPIIMLPIGVFSQPQPIISFLVLQFKEHHKFLSSLYILGNLLKIIK